MKTMRYVYWQDGDMWLGYLEEFPDYLTQGQDIHELEENLKDIFTELTGGQIPGVRRVAELRVAGSASTSLANLNTAGAYYFGMVVGMIGITILAPVPRSRFRGIAKSRSTSRAIFFANC